jgi:hypothetical protein
MPGSKHSLSLARSVACCSAALAFGLLVAGCDAPAVDPQRAAGATDTTAADSPARARAPSSGAEPYGAFAARRELLLADAVEALDETYTALGLLAQQDTDGASEALARATGKLEIVLTAEPRLALAPVAVNVRTHDVLAAPEEVDRLRRLAEEALDDGRLQVGRKLIENLASEHVLSITNLPLATYPNALKRAAALIKGGRPLDAIAALEAALATLVVAETIFPLPLVRAQLLLERARPAAEKTPRSPEDDTRVRALLVQAREQLDLARALGYGTRSDLDDLYDALESIEARVESSDSAQGLFDQLKRLFDKARRAPAAEGGAGSPQETATPN